MIVSCGHSPCRRGMTAHLASPRPQVDEVKEYPRSIWGPAFLLAVVPPFFSSLYVLSV